jgi:hypothetical protein
MRGDVSGTRAKEESHVRDRETKVAILGPLCLTMSVVETLRLSGS